MKSTSIKKFISCTLAAMVLITSTFSIETTIKAKVIDSFDIYSIKNEKYKAKKKLKPIKADFKLSDIPRELKENAEIDTAKLKGIDSVDNLDLYSITTIEKDNKRTLRIFDNPIKYYDKKNHEVKFINNSFKKSEKKTKQGNKYAYENADNDIKVYIPQNNNENVSVENADGVSLKFQPYVKKKVEVITKSFEFQNEKEEVAEYTDIFGEGYSLQYIPQNDGVKENIYIEKNGGIYQFDFEVTAKGISPSSMKGRTINFINNETKEIVFTLGEIFIKDSYLGNGEGNRHISFDNYYEIQKISEESYKLTYILDSGFLNNPQTIYPVVVDPSISPIKDIQDAPVYSGKAKENFKTNAWIEIGKVGGSYGTGHGYFQTDVIDKYKYINSNNITKASLRVYEGSGTTYASKVVAYDTKATWTSKGITWNNRPGKSGSALDTVKINSSGFYDFNITSLVKKWLKNELGEGGQTYKKGVVLIPNTSETKRKDFCSANYGTTSKRPSIKIEYTEDTSIGNNTYFLENYNSKQYLAANYNTDNVFQYAKTYTDKQQWIVKHIGSGYYTIANKYYGNNGFLDVEDVSASPINADIWQGGSGNVIRYKIVKNNDGSGTYRIMSKQLDDLKALTIRNGSTTSGANAVFGNYVGNNQSKWKFSVASSRYTLPDMYVKGITSVSKVITPLSQYQFSIQLVNRYSKVNDTKTFVEIIDENNNVVYTNSVNTFAMDGEENSAVSFQWHPTKEGQYTIKATANYNNSVKEYDISNNSTTVKVEVVKGYYLRMDNFLDNGFVVKYGNGNEVKAKELVKRVTGWVAQYYKDYFGVILDNHIDIFTSAPDKCKYEIMNREGETRTFEQLINAPCPYDSKEHRPCCTYKFRPLIEFIGKQYQNTGFPIVWTGHTLFNDNEGIKEWNRSFRISNPQGICMIGYMEENKFVNNSIYTLLHETAHILGGRDHYHEEDSNGKCSNYDICSTCGVHKRDARCIFGGILVNESMLTFDKDKLFCKDCIEEIRRKIKEM